MQKLKADPEYKDLSKRRKAAKQQRNAKKLSGIYVEMGDHLRQNYGKLQEKARGKYEKAIVEGKRSTPVDFEDCYLAYRALSDIALEEGDEALAIRNADLTFSYARDSKNPDIIQLAYHQRAHIYDECDQHQQARKFVEEGLEFLERNSRRIDKDERAVENGGTSARRRAGMQSLLGSIYVGLGMMDEGLASFDECAEYARDTNEWVLLHTVLSQKLKIAQGNARIVLAKELVEVAGKVKNKEAGISQGQARLDYGRESLRLNQLDNAKLTLWKVFNFCRKELNNEQLEDLRKCLVFIYKTSLRLNKLANDQMGRLVMRTEAQTYEKVADEAADLQLPELALEYYEKMHRTSTTPEDKRRALLSLAVIHDDELKDFRQAVSLYQELLAHEQKMGYSREKLLKTEILMAKAAASDESSSHASRLALLQDVYAKCRSNKSKLDLLPDYIDFMEQLDQFLRDEDTIAEKRRELKRLERQAEDEMVDDDEEETEDAFTDQFDAMDEEAVLKILKDEMSAIEEEERLEKDKKVRNKHGESNMHIAAREGNEKLLKKMIEKGYNINERDFGGWTPLSEAVSAGQVKCVILLCENKAEVNLSSKEGLVDEGDKVASGGSQTVLMEACSRGDARIAKILIRFGACASKKDNDEWTAVDYLRDHLQQYQATLQPEKIEELMKLIDLLENKQRKEGFTPRTSPPPRRRAPPTKKLSMIGRTIRKQPRGSDSEHSSGAKFSDDSDDELKLISSRGKKSEHGGLMYKRTIQGLGSRAGKKNGLHPLGSIGQHNRLNEADALDERSMALEEQREKTLRTDLSDDEFLECDEDDSQAFSYTRRKKRRRLFEEDEEEF